MRLVHYYPRARAEPSGVTAAMDLWVEAAQRHGVEALVLHAQQGESGYIKHLGSTRATFVPLGLARMLMPGDVLVLHEGWTLSNIVAAGVAQRAGVPYVLVPHGVYEPGIMAGLKLQRLRFPVERRVLAGAARVHVFHHSEVPLVHAIAPTARPMVSPTGMDLSTDTWQGGGGYLAWFGRIDVEHKGLDILVRAVASLPAGQRPRVQLRGYDFNGGLQVLRRLIAECGVEQDVELAGPVWGQEKVEFMRHCDAYLHLSAWESMGMALLEALAAGTPTVMSDTIHLSRTCADAGAAVVVARSEAAVVAGIEQVRRDAAGYSERGRQLIASAFDWDDIVPPYLTHLRSLVA